MVSVRVNVSVMIKVMFSCKVKGSVSVMFRVIFRLSFNVSAIFCCSVMVRFTQGSGCVYVYGYCHG